MKLSQQTFNFNNKMFNAQDMGCYLRRTKLPGWSLFSAYLLFLLVLY